MNIIDILLLIVLAWGAFRGFIQGFVLQIVTFVAIFIGIWLSIKLSGVMSEFLTAKLDIHGKYLPVSSFAIIFILVVIGAHLLGMALTRFFEAAKMGWLNRVGGIAFGILKMAFIASVVIAILMKINNKVPVLPKAQVEESVIYEPVKNLAPAVFPYLHFNDIKTKLNLDKLK